MAGYAAKGQARVAGPLPYQTPEYINGQGGVSRVSPVRQQMNATKSKYGVIQTASGKERRTYRGRVYASVKERDYAELLDLRKLASEIRAWTPQVRIPLEVNGEHVCFYVVDFRVILADGSVELVEVKGYPTPEWKLKRRLFEATWLREHPEVRFCVRE
jgi:hypothetical protein